MRKMKWTMLTLLLTVCCTSIFAYTEERFQSTIPNTLGHENGFSPYFRREGQQEEVEKSPLFVSGTLLVLTPQTGYVPKKGLTPGLRLETGLNAPRWEAGFTYTHYSISSSSPLFDPFELDQKDPLNKVKVDHSFALNDYEGVIAIPYVLKNGVSLQPLFGIEYAITKRGFDVRYKKTPLSDNGSFTKSKGFGPQIGIKIQKALFKGFSLSGAVTQSVLQNRTSWFSEKFQRFTPVTKLRVGTEWSVGDDREGFFHLSAGYERQYWHNEVVVRDDNKLKSQNLGLQGFNIQAKLDF